MEVNRVSECSPIYDEIEIGYQLPKLIKKPTYIQLFRYSAVTWNTHRIHYDQAYAREEGYPDVLVQSHLHGAFLTQLCTDWMGIKGELSSFSVSVKRYAIPGDTLTCNGVVIKKDEKNGEGFVTVDLEEVNQRDEVCTIGNAVIKIKKN